MKKLTMALLSLMLFLGMGTAFAQSVQKPTFTPADGSRNVAPGTKINITLPAAVKADIDDDEYIAGVVLYVENDDAVVLSSNTATLSAIVQEAFGVSTGPLEGEEGEVTEAGFKAAVYTSGMWMTNVIVSKNASGPTKIRMRLALVPYGGDLEYSEEFTANYTVDAGAEAKPMAPTFTLNGNKLSMENGYDEDDPFHMLCYKVGADADFEDLNVSTMYNYQYTAPITYTKGQTVKAVTVEMAVVEGAPVLTLSDVSTFFEADPLPAPSFANVGEVEQGAALEIEWPATG
ncbi:MAG: hypothetical protein K2K51_05430, partial [Bacteroidales bacterium]|nr:hypothetical protein [Bacteroidales bacterium]